MIVRMAVGMFCRLEWRVPFNYACGLSTVDRLFEMGIHKLAQYAQPAAAWYVRERSYHNM